MTGGGDKGVTRQILKLAAAQRNATGGTKRTKEAFWLKRVLKLLVLLSFTDNRWMIFKSKTKEFYIDLESHRYYNPGETVRGKWEWPVAHFVLTFANSTGDVVLNLSELTRIYHIQVTFTGTVQAANNTLQLFKRECEVATNPNEPGKPHHLEARSHRFPFEFSIPGESAEIPTTMKVRV